MVVKMSTLVFWVAVPLSSLVKMEVICSSEILVSSQCYNPEDQYQKMGKSFWEQLGFEAGKRNTAQVTQNVKSKKNSFLK
jgi:hypothetical protein